MIELTEYFKRNLAQDKEKCSVPLQERLISKGKTWTKGHMYGSCR